MWVHRQEAAFEGSWRLQGAIHSIVEETKG